MTRCLVTGAAGFLGYYVAKALSERPGYEVFCVDNFVRGERDDAYATLLGKPNVTGIEMDISDVGQIAKLPKAVDYVYHLAALNGTQNFYERPFAVLKHSTVPTFHLLEQYRSAPLKRFVYAGSSESYASTVTHFNWPVPTDETVPLGIEDIVNPRWSYAVSKLHGEVLTYQAAREFGFPCTIARYHNAYGPRMGDKHVIPDFLNRLKRGVVEIYGYADTRSFIYAEDAARATLLVGESVNTANEIIHIGSAEEISIHDLAKRMLKLAGREEPITLHPSPKGSVKRRAANIDKLTRLTGYAPEWSLERGLKETLAFYL